MISGFYKIIQLQRYKYCNTTNNYYKQFNVDNSALKMRYFSYNSLTSLVVFKAGEVYP